MEIKYKITPVPDVRGLDVQYYTDAIIEAQGPIWASERAKMKLAYPWMTEDEIMDNVMSRYPAGARLHITFYEDILPTGEELKKRILGGVPLEWLTFMHKLSLGELTFDLTACGATFGEEQVTTLEEIQQLRAVPAPIETADPAPMIVKVI